MAALEGCLDLTLKCKKSNKNLVSPVTAVTTAAPVDPPATDSVVGPVQVTVPPPKEMLLPGGQGVMQALLKQSVVGAGQMTPTSQAKRAENNLID